MSHAIECLVGEALFLLGPDSAKMVEAGQQRGDDSDRQKTCPLKISGAFLPPPVASGAHQTAEGDGGGAEPPLPIAG
jgi:hypothetical protein